MADFSTTTENTSVVNVYDSGTCGVRVVTFDLDNTLWKTSPVICEANDALAKYLESYLPLNHKRVEVIMNELFKENRTKYAPNNPEASYATHLTRLRKDAIRELFLFYNKGRNENDANLFAEEAFQVWTEARHNAIPSFFAQSVLSSLEKIRNLKTLDGHPIVVGAITDGNSDPRNVPILKEFFDFCINSETVGVSKPNKEVYLEAVPKFSFQPAVQSIFANHLNSDIIDKNSEINYDYILDNQIIGPWWIHIGDDFIKDIVAANELGIRSIWCRELVKEKLRINEKKITSETESEKRDVSDFMREVTENGGRLSMKIGSDDFLTDSIHNEFADAIVDEFEHLTTILAKWNEKSISVVEDQDIYQSIESENDTLIKSEYTEVDNQNKSEETLDSAIKFCMKCGTKLPSNASFCTSCGTKQ